MRYLFPSWLSATNWLSWLLPAPNPPAAAAENVPTTDGLNPDISIGAKTTYSLFLSYAWHNNLCFPGQDTLAKALGMSIGSVNAFIKELERCGLIEITRRGQGKTNLYTINFIVKRKASKS